MSKSYKKIKILNLKEGKEVTQQGKKPVRLLNWGGRGFTLSIFTKI